MRIAYNTQAMKANDALNKSDNLVSKSIERLSSGFKVNSAKDNPSGYAISKRMNMQLEGLSQAQQSANDGISIIEIADGALTEVSDMLNRINELCVKASTGTLTDNDREIIQAEVNQLKQEITRIAKDTEFNGQTLLDGTFDLKGYSMDNGSVKVNYYDDTVLPGQYDIDDIKNIMFDDRGNIVSASGLPATPDDLNGKITLGAGFPSDAKISAIKGNHVTISGANDFEITITLEGAPAAKDSISTQSFGGAKLDITGIGAMQVQIGANEGQLLQLRIPEISLENMGIDKIDVSTAKGAEEALGLMRGALSYISDVRSRLGAYENRLEHTVNSLDITSENLTKAYSGIMDVDMATETTEYTTQQVISQAATSILAQANERPSQVLQLLQ